MGRYSSANSLKCNGSVFVATIAAIAALYGCSSDALTLKDDGETKVDSGMTLPAEARGMVDVLIMVDNSGSMREKQALLRKAFPAFMEAIRGEKDVLLSLHLGVVSSDLGAGKDFVASSNPCGRPGGDKGKLQAKAGCGLDESSTPFIVSIDSEQSGRMENFTGSIADAFSCIADLNTGGCAFEHQLESVRLALSASTNKDFLRPDAALAIILLTDEDDCSAPADSDLFNDRHFEGQQGSLRCNIAGHECNGSPPPSVEFATALANCKAAPQGGGRLIPVEDITAFVKDLKQNFPRRITVAAITGIPSGASASYAFLNADQGLEVKPICTSESHGVAAPSLRISQFVNSFGAQGLLESICADDYAPALERIGKQVASTLK
jgi:hypothetical protein